MADDQITVWRLMAHHEAPDDALRWFSHSNLIAIGWGKVGSIETGRYQSARDVSDALRETYQFLNNIGSGGPCLFAFCHRMSRGDLVIVSGEGHRSLVMEVGGDYEYKSEPEPAPIGDYQHQRKATMIAMDPDDLWIEAGADAREGHSIRWALVECAKPINQATKERLLHSPSDTAPTPASVPDV
jgi:hypothetical protein